MKNILFFLGITLFTGCLGVDKKPEPDSLTKEEVYTIINAFDKAWQSKKTAGVDAALGAHYIYFTPSGNKFSRDSLLATAASPAYRLRYAERKIMDVFIEGNTAVVNTRWMGSGEYRGAAFNDDQRCSVIITKRNGAVRILSEHCTTID